MISNIGLYYRQCLNTNEKFYVEVRNACSHFVYIFITYTIGSKRISKPSPPFGKGKVQRMPFPNNATNVQFILYDCSFNPPSIVCNKIVPNNTISRFKVVRSHQGRFQCISI